MTPQAHRLLEFVKAQLAETGICPSYVEMAAAIGVCSKGHVARLISQLLRDGYLIRRDDRAQRALCLPRRGLCDIPTWMLTAELERRGLAVSKGAEA